MTAPPLPIVLLIGSLAPRYRLMLAQKPHDLWRIAARKLDQLESVEMLEELRTPPGNRLESLTGERKGQFSIRINERYRVCFLWIADGPDVVEIVDYH